MPFRRKPSRTPKPIAAPVQRPTGKSSDAGAALLLLPVPLPDTPDDLRLWFKEFELWLLLLRRHFYDFTDGYVGSEGDPCRLAPHPPLDPEAHLWTRGRRESWERAARQLWAQSGVKCARAGNTRTNTRSSVPPAGSSAAERVARAIARQLEFSPL